MLDLFELVTNSFRLGSDAFYDFSHRFVNTTFQVHRVGTRRYILQTDTDNRLCQNCCSCRTVTGIVVSLGSNFLNQLSTHVFKRASNFNFFSYRYTVFCNVRSTEFLFDDHITSLRTQCYFYCVSQFIHTFLQKVAGIHIVFNFFCHDFYRFI